MLNYEDLLEVGTGDRDRGEFCRAAVEQFMTSQSYREARDAEAYYARHNITIENFEKYLYTLSGNKIPDVFSANHRLKTTFFRRLVQQQVQYVLGNGITLSDEKNKQKLGKDFDFQLQSAAKRAMVCGRSFGFWNFDHMEVFGYADTNATPGFCPLYSEKTAELMGGIRYWFKNIGETTIFRATLYEPDGFTEFRKKGESDAEVIEPKRGYKLTTIATDAAGIVDVIESNYDGLPIVQLFANDTHQSELVGIRESIDCYDLVKSGLADDIDDTSGFYWLITNTGGMQDKDLAQFVQRMKTLRAAVAEGDDVKVEPHTMEIPTEARRTMMEILRADIYEDFQALDVKTLSAAAKTTQEIQAAYQAQDNKCADFEYYIISFVQNILRLAGIDDNPTLTWNRVVNQAEQTNMILMAANYLSDECIIKHLPFITPEEADEEIKQRTLEEYQRFETDPAEDENEEQEPADQNGDE